VQHDERRRPGGERSGGRGPARPRAGPARPRAGRPGRPPPACPGHPRRPLRPSRATSGRGGLSRSAARSSAIKARSISARRKANWLVLVGGDGPVGHRHRADADGEAVDVSGRRAAWRRCRRRSYSVAVRSDSSLAPPRTRCLRTDQQRRNHEIALAGVLGQLHRVRHGDLLSRRPPFYRGRGAIPTQSGTLLHESRDEHRVPASFGGNARRPRPVCRYMDR
jgi:hypothetical protein